MMTKPVIPSDAELLQLIPKHQNEASVTPASPAIPDVKPAHRDQIISHNNMTTRRPRLPHRVSRSHLSHVEVTTEFFPLLEGDDVDSFENGQIVRVELPGSALIAVGLPVGVESAGEVVEADVLLGHDGLARAIRFVR